MVSSKPLPPIPAPAVEKEKRAQLFPSMTNLRRKSEPPAADSNASPTQVQTEQLQTQANTQAQPIGTISSISGMISSFISSTALSTTKTPTTESNRPSRPSTPVPTAATVVAVPLETAMAEETTPTVPAKQEMVTLDQRSFQHLRAIARQSIASSCLEPEILWLKLFMDMVQKLAANASDTWLQVEAAYESALEEQLEGTATLVEKDKLNDKEKHKEGKDKPVFSYRVSLAKQISTKQECTFTVGRFEGESILQEERSITEQRKSAEDDGTKILLGGTVFLAAGSEDLPKAGKIVEILVFALCSLQLETYLMRDHDVLRPDPALNIHEADTKFSKPPVTTQYSHDTSKRASKGSMFFGWLSRGSLPAKYKKGTTQLALDSDTKLDQYRNNSGSGAVNAISSSSDDFGLVDDPQGFQNCRFAKIIQQVEKAIISVSPNVVFPPPHILLRLRDEEAFGLDSIRKPYNWEDVEFVARKIGFGNRMSRQNTAGVSQVARFGAITGHAQNDGSKANRLPADSRAGLDHLMTNSNSLQGIFNHQSISFSYSYYWSATAAAPCHPPNLITVEYYRKEGQYEDMGLGEMIEFICKRAYSKCSDPTCEHKRLEHISTYTHGEARINITVEQPRPDSATNFDSEEFTPFLSNNKTIAVWTRCKMCKARTKPKALSRASRLYSFGKYLELLLYGQRFEPGPRQLCDHMATKDSIARCFLYRGLVVTFEYESIDLFEMRISRLQVHEDFHPMPRFDPGHTDEDKHEYSTAYSTSTGPSPRASVLSVYLNSDYITEKEQMSLLDATRLEILHFYESCKKIIVIMEQHLGETKSISKYVINKARDSSNAVAMDPIKKAALSRLDELGERWKADEFDLYDQLKRISICRLNDLRNRFVDCIKRTMRSMEAWQKEYNPESLKSSKGQLDWVLPEYFTHDALHTFPGSSVIVREDEPSSIIASTLSRSMEFTQSSSDYLSLISSLLHPDSESTEVEGKAPLPPEKDFDINSLNIPTRGPLKTSRSAGSVTLTPRKSGSSGSEGSTAHGSPGKENSASQKGELETEDDIDEDEEEDEEDSFLVVDGYQTSVKFVPASKVDLSSLIQNGTMSPRSTIGLNFGGRHSKNSMLSPNTVDKKGDLVATRPFSMVALPNSTSALTTSLMPANGEETPTNPFFVSPPESRSITPTPGTKSKGAFGYHSLASGLSGTMKGLSLNTLSEKIGGGFSSYSTSGTYNEKAEREHFSDSVDKAMKETLAIVREKFSTTRSPHLKARFSHGKTSFSCVVYYAAEFDTLRRRCGIHQTYVPSLSR
ncbi:1-phosphatidylinositol-3-phosphate 5-kinase, partial [Entomortierella chlamydospora]